jgi:hypothetical protein
VRIRFDVPADPTYPGKAAAALSRVRLRKYTYIGAVLAGTGVAAFVAAREYGWGEQFSLLWMSLVTAGVLSMLYGPWVRSRARRRSSEYAVEGGYDITDTTIRMRSGSESSGIAWDEVSKVLDTPGFWVVYVGKMPATVIPRELMSANDIETLRDFMLNRGLLQTG